MAKDTKKKETPVATPSKEVYFNKLSATDKQVVLVKLAKGEVVLRGPDQIVLPTK